MNDHCPVDSKSHRAHDDEIARLQSIIDHLPITTRKLAERIASIEIERFALRNWANRARERLLFYRERFLTLREAFLGKDTP